MIPSELVPTFGLDGSVPIPSNQLLEHAGRLKGKVVLITGAGRGIGKETAIQFANFGAKIVIGDIDLVSAQETANTVTSAGGQAIFQNCDVTVWDDLVDLYNLAIAKFGSVDVVVPNAGVPETSFFYNVCFDSNGRPQEPHLREVEVNLKGVLYTAHLAQHYLRVHAGQESSTKPLKAIVFIGSMSPWASYSPAPIYTATKHAILGLMRSVGPVLNNNGIRTVCITPSFADVASSEVLFPTVIRVAGVIIYTVSHPDPAISGCGYVLADNDWKVLKVPREEFKAGVYKLLDERVSFLLK
ncbi:NAD(P)-binding protein [Gymnopus androsaceus JB14]|uniref:NAD(P)-binding protein n=1 Tax=Gymnopus androsaceus JB14 TaxID=1447944 RepID=A0A6A4GL41_9AGAR|nr:NAD(P)-binding protein [Gymnopus androsaceus JB14]